MIIRLRPWPQDPDEVCMERAAAADAAAAAAVHRAGEEDGL